MKKRNLITYSIGLLLILTACGNSGSVQTPAEDHVNSAVVEADETIDTTMLPDADETGSQIADEDLITEQDPIADDEDSTVDQDSAQDAEKKGELTFNTVDFYGNEVTEEVLSDSSVVLVNLWEPWCGPCVREMPDLEILYEKYKDSGLLILGVYTTTDMDEDVEYLIDDIGITYPVIKADENLMRYEQSYVPATFIFDGYGNLLDSSPVEGSRSYDDWEKIILQYLK